MKQHYLQTYSKELKGIGTLSDYQAHLHLNTLVKTSTQNPRKGNTGKGKKWGRRKTHWTFPTAY